MKSRSWIKAIAALHVITAVEIVLFWIGFHTGVLFPRDVLAPRIANFAGYYAWETAFVVPDAILALAMLVGGVRLLRDHRDHAGRTLLVAASGGCMFLGLLDLVYDAANGMYALGHLYSVVLLLIGVFLPMIGLLSIIVLHHGGRTVEMTQG